ncbi:MAG: hypothetical protein K1X29_11375 [Bdellovibrionales bacterium]|nr:hypothetical protein [Bdellovibrionales bacterium]
MNFWQTQKLMYFLFGLFLILTQLILPPLVALAKPKYGKISVHGSLQMELNKVLKATDGLQKACITRNEKQIDRAIKILILNLNQANQKSNLAKDQKPHLSRMINAAINHLEVTLNRSGESRKDSLKEAFNHLVQIAKVYKLDEYQVFFCPLDKSVWLQKNNKPNNPINPQKYGSCGKLVK